MSLKIVLLVHLVIATNILNAQSVSTQMGGRAAGLANASSTLSDEWSLHHNIGGLAGNKQTNLSFAGHILPNLEGASRSSVSTAIPAKFGVVGLGVFRFGDNIYNEQLITIAYGSQLGITSLGIKASYIQYSIEGFGQKKAISLGLGGITQLTEQLTIGAYVLNINQPRLSHSNDRLLPKMVAGVGFKPTERVLLVTELEKDLTYRTQWKSGLEYNLSDKIFFRTGFNLHPNASFFGLGIKTWRVAFDYALQYNRTLTLGHHASAVYTLQKKKGDA